MSSIRNAAAAAIAAALLTACGSTGTHGTAAPSGGAAATSASASAKGAPEVPGSLGGGSGTALPSGPLTMTQAEHAYLAITGPGNVIAQTVARDGSGGTPYSQVRADLLAYAKELQAEIGKFHAVRWPSQVQSRIDSLIRSDFPAFIGCLQAEAAASSMSASQAVSNSNRDCMAADNATIPSSLASTGG